MGRFSCYKYGCIRNTNAINNTSEPNKLTNSALPIDKFRKLTFTIPTVAPNSSVLVRVYQYYTGMAVCTGDGDYSLIYRNTTSYGGSYNNDCGNNLQTINHKSEYPIAAVTFVSVHRGGNDVNLNDNYWVNLEISSYQYTNMADPASDHYLEYFVTLPAGMQFAGNAAVAANNPDLYFQRQDGTKYYPTSIILSGNKVICRFAKPDVNKIASLHTFYMRTTTNSVACGTHPIVVGMDFYPHGSSKAPMHASCYDFNLTVHCPIACSTGGMENDIVSFRRLTLGTIPTVDQVSTGITVTNLTNLKLNNFVAHDEVLISQLGKVITTTANPNWNSGYYVVKPNAASYLMVLSSANSGRIKITRGTTVYEYENIPTSTATANLIFRMQLSAANILAGTPKAGSPILPTNFVFENNDIVEAGIVLKSNAEIGAVTVFGTEYYLNNTGNVNDKFNCKGGFSANALLGTIIAALDGGNVSNIDGCVVNNAMTLRYYSTVNGGSSDSFFPNEFRQTIWPKTFYLRDVPTGVTIEKVAIKLALNPYPKEFLLDVQGTLVNGVYSIDLDATFANLKNVVGSAGYNLDEGFNMFFTPYIKAECNSVSNFTLQGEVDHHDLIPFTNRINLNQTATKLTYNVNRGVLDLTIANNIAVGQSNEVSWNVAVTNPSANSIIENGWIATENGSSIQILSVEPIANLSSNVATGAAILPNTNGIIELGQFTASAQKYYKITATFSNCTVESTPIYFGNSCAGYPTSVATAICKNSKNLTVDPRNASLQLSITSQPLDSKQYRLCDEDIPYEVIINNSGQGYAKNIALDVILPGTGGVSYKTNSLQVEYPVGSGTWIPLDASHTSINGNSSISFKLDVNGVLNNSISNFEIKTNENLKIKFNLIIESCDFVSGQRLRFLPKGTNPCQSSANGSMVTTNRINVAGTPMSIPDLQLNSSTLPAVVQTDGSLKSKYTFELFNNDGILPADNSLYSASVKLPSGWTMDSTTVVNDPQSTVNVGNIVYNTTTGKYNIEFASPVNIGERIKFTIDLVLPASEALLAPCGNQAPLIREEAIATFIPVSNCTPPLTCKSTTIVEERYATVIIIPTPGAIVLVQNQEEQSFCSSDNPTLADLEVGNGTEGYNVVWYATQSATTRLPLTTPLVDGTTYYAANTLVPNGICESVNRTAVLVNIDNAIIANAGLDQQLATITFTMSANQATAPAVGTWSVVSVVDGNGITLPSSVVQISNINAYNTTVTIAPLYEAVLQWTIVNGTCESSDTVVLKSTESIDAINDDVSGSPVNGNSGNTNVVNVLTNDVLNGTPNIPAGSVTITIETPAVPVTSGANVPSIDITTGVLSVPSGTPAGTYTIEYKICTINNTCDTAIATVVVEAAEIVANDDSSDPINGYVGGTTPSVLDNDTLNGQVVNPSDVNLTPGTPSNQGLSMNTDGTITVAPQTPAGTYQYPYTICEKLNPTNCDTAVATVVVEAAEIVANDDSSDPINGYVGGTTPSVLDNDTLNGQVVNPSDVNLTPGTSPNAGLTMNPNGTITVAPQTPAGTYQYPYTICEKLNPTNCDTAVATVVVEAAEIVANDDSYGPVNGLYGDSNVGNVLVNDTLNGDSATTSDVTISVITPADAINNGPVPSIDVATGNVSIPAGTPAGSYEIAYQICEILNAINCDTATVRVVVKAAEIVANDDSSAPINGYVGGTTPSVLDNDTLNGQVVNPSDVNLTPGTSPNAGLTMNPNGTITVAPQTPAGTYTYEYTICEILNPTNCDTAVATVVVEAAEIVANDDSSDPINGYVGGTTPSVLDNDTLNGQVVNPSEITLTPGTPSNPGLSMNADGTITVAPQTPAGTYTYEYTICEILNPTNCDTAVATVVVEAAEIVANDDSSDPINGYVGGTTPSVLDNDTLNGQVVNPSEITLTPGTPSNPGLSMNSDGTITVAPQTPAGTYTYEYTICEILNPTNCDTAVATVVVEAAEIVANDDSSDPINGYVGGTTPSVLDNDTLNGQVVNPSEITLTPGTPSNPGLSMNSDGTITVAPQTPAGTYTYEYTICEILNPTNCDTAVATVVVEAAEIVANDDSSDPINGYVGGTTPSVLDNDTLNGQVVNPSEITLTPGTPSNPGLSMNSDGTITVAPQTPAGTYTYEYTICEILNPTNCDTAVATVVVEAAEIVANDDSSDPINGYVGGTTPSVLDNDTLNGQVVNPSEITLTPGTPSNPGLSMNADGTITVAPQTPAGTYTYEYTICEILNPTNCDTAVATVVVEAAEIVANDDEYVAFDSKIGGTTPSVLVNDTLNGAPVISAEITLTPGSTPNAGITMNADGTISVAAGTPAGTYQYPYTICEVLNPTNCDDAVATVVIDAAPADVTIECSDALPTDQPIFSASSCDPVTVTMTEERVEGSCANNYIITRTWVGIDSCGNERILTQTITVEDTTAPTFVEVVPTDVTVECNAVPSAPVLTAVDTCGSAVVTFTELREDGSCANEYTLTRTWVATDACGNTSEAVQVITVQDTSAPVFVEALPAAELYVRCADLKPAEMLTAIDACGDATISFYEEKVPGDCEAKYDLLRTWTATDVCGNETIHTQTIHVSCPVEIYNAVTPNGDGMNDDLVLKGIECYPGNSVEIYNRWGVLVYETKNYNSNGNTFKGYSEGRATIKGDSKLPSGTYYYIIKYTFDLGNGEVYPTEQAGYLHLENN